MSGYPDIQGASELYQWFGYWPTFHDAKLVEFSELPDKCIRCKLLTWRITREVDEKGYFIHDHHIGVTLLMRSVRSTVLERFAIPNTVLELEIKPIPDGFELIFDDVCDGTATVRVRTASIALTSRRAT
jgi:hypothetical protein